MKNLWVLILLVSLGLNLGLAWHVYRSGTLPERSGHRPGRMASDIHGHAHPAHDDTMGWHRLHKRRIDRMASRLELTPDQVGEFQASHRETGRLLQEKRQLVRAMRAELLGLVAQEPLDKGAVRRTMAALSAGQAGLDSLVAETMLQEMENLAPEQRTRYLKMLPLVPGTEPGRGRGRGRENAGQ